MNKIVARILSAFIIQKEKRKRFRKKILNRQHHLNPDFVVKGSDNKLIITDEQGNEESMTTNFPGMKINVQGVNNTIKIHLPLNPTRTRIEVLSNNTYTEIGPSPERNFNLSIIMKAGEGQKCIIGKNTSIEDATISLNERASFFIGEDCMLSGMIRIWPTDGHAILDEKTGEVLNKADTPLIVGNHVWIGEGVRITKKAHIYDNSIVAGGTVACKDYKESNVIIAGNPGRIVKRGVTWSRMNAYDIEEQKLKENPK